MWGIMKAVSGDMRKLSMLYKRAARFHFYKDQMRTSDYYHQWYLNMVGRFPSANITNCHKRQDWDAQLERWRAEKKKNFRPETAEEAHVNYVNWMTDSNKHQIAAEMVRIMALFRLTTCIELGCHAGALLKLADMIFKHHRTTRLMPAKFIGIEPDPMPLKVGTELHGFEFHLGDHRKLKAFNKRRFGLMVCSFVLCLNEEETVREILRFAAKTCRFILLAEDLSNMFEAKPVIRRHYMIHNYARLLKEQNFLIMDKIFLEDANEAANGILISENRN
jgi:hypothetical protein